MSTLSSSSLLLVNGDKDNYHKMKAKGGIAETSPLVPPHSPTRRPPPDWFFATYFIFYLLGVGHLLPWNFFITANKYFEHKFACPEGNSSTCASFLKNDFENYFAVASMLPICIMTAVNIYLQSKVHFKYRMLISMIGIFALFAITVGMVEINSASWVNGFFAVTLLIVVAISVFSAIFQSSTFGFSGVFPPKYTTGVMSGQAIAGIVSSLAQILSLVAASNNPDTSALIYFSTAVGFILLCFVSFIVLMRLRFVNYYLKQTSVEVQRNRQAILERSTNVRLETSPPFFIIFKEIVVYAISIYLVFTVTLTLFPAVLSHLKSTVPNPQASAWTDTYFSPLVCFLMFNSADFTGRIITQWFTVGKNQFVMLIASVLRLVFIPLVLLCNFGQTGSGVPPVIFNNDVFPVLFVLLLGFSNGYLGSLAMIAAPESLPPDQRETASTIMVFFLSFGLISGSATSFIWTKLVLKFS